MSNEQQAPQTTAADLLTIIAERELSLETLETRNSDSLDFHELSVWEIKAALEAAFLLGGKVGASLSK